MRIESTTYTLIESVTVLIQLHKEIAFSILIKANFKKQKRDYKTYFLNTAAILALHKLTFDTHDADE